MAGWLGRNVLVISPTPTAPADFGNRRSILNRYRRLQRHGARIIFVYYPAEHDWRGEVPAGMLQVMQGQWDEFYIAPVSRPLHAEPAGSHHEIDEWWDDALGAMIAWVFATHRIDVCVVNYTWLTRAFAQCPEGVLRILDTHDRFSGRKEMLQENGIRPEFFYVTEQTERDALLRSDIVWAVKEEEAAFFRALSGRPSLVLPHVELPQQAYLARVPREGLLRFGFFAARNHINSTNYRRFFEILERWARQLLLPARFVLAGSMCDMLGDTEFPFLERLGRVGSEEDFYRACDVVVVPMEFSTGLKVKVGEALGYGKALISHAHAFDGYTPHHPFHMLDSFDAICKAIVQLIDAPEGIEEMERASIRASLDAERLAEHCVIHSIAANRSRRRFVALVPADLLAQPQVVDHLTETLSYINHIGRPCLYVTGDAAEVDQGVWRQFARYADLFAEPNAGMAARVDTAEHGLSFADPSVFLANGFEVLYALRCDLNLELWQRHARECLLRLEDWGSEPGIEIARSAACLLAMPTRERLGMVVVGSAAAESQLRRLGLNDLRHVRIPLLRDGATSRILPWITTKPRAGICLIMAGAAPEVLRAVVANPAFRTRWAARPRMLVMTKAEQEALPADGSFASFEIIRPAELLSSLRAGRHVPELLVELGAEGRGWEWMREICARAIIPYLSLAFAPLANGMSANSTGRTTPAPYAQRTRQVLSVLDAVYSQGFIEDEQATIKKFWAFGQDSGWAWLWKLVKYGM